ncbi:AMP-binding protein [Agrobacterium tumefaciens]|uniref:AMP-binding protein n=1 Tax=Agrobacterium tumefaciens TaxID=358 RepID=UPI001CBD7813|nr:AMP-binding protein [Agrobacterium tumefaciens]
MVNGLSAVPALERHEERGIVLRGPVLENPPFETIGAMLDSSAQKAPDHPFLIHPTGIDRTVLTFSDARQLAHRLANVLVDLGLSQERPLAILSGNTITHALLSLAAQIAGIPVAPISVAYSQLSDLSRLAQIFDVLTPGLVFAEDGAAFSNALKLAVDMGAKTMVSRNGAGDAERLFADALRNQTEIAASKIPAETTAKILFTSGSTGTPKGVIVTHRMMCSNQEAIAQVWPSVVDSQPVAVDWLPWNHVFGGNLVFNFALRHAGTLVIDDGRPLPGQFEKTIQNLKDYSPTVHFGVPRGFEELVRVLDGDEDFARLYFSRLQVMFTAGASLPATVWNRYRELAERHGLPGLGMYVGWGSTETSPVASISPRDNVRADNIGSPLPGAEIKLVPNEDKSELVIRGPMVTPGYWRRPDLSAQAFDQDGFYRIGDAGKLVDEADSGKGIQFDGRVAENFKLVTGTWVQAGALRLAAVSAGGSLIQDAVVTGHDRDSVGLLIFLNRTVARQVSGKPDAELTELCTCPLVRASVSAALANLSGAGSSSRVARALILPDMPSIQAGEITDKGYLNQRALLRSRADLVERLYADPPHSDVVLPASKH